MDKIDPAVDITISSLPLGTWTTPFLHLTEARHGHMAGSSHWNLSLSKSVASDAKHFIASASLFNIVFSGLRNTEALC